MSMLDSFSGYNKFLVDEEDREKTTFITPWETYAYAKMPFDLKNVEATFQTQTSLQTHLATYLLMLLSSSSLASSSLDIVMLSAKTCGK
jgi:hypothetical protein